MKRRSKKSDHGHYDHVPWGLNRLKTGTRNQKKTNSLRGLKSKRRKAKKSVITFIFYIACIGDFGSKWQK